MKKAELSFSTIVAALLALLVFVILAIVFRKQLTTLLQPLTDIIKNVVGLSSDIGR